MAERDIQSLLDALATRVGAAIVLEDPDFRLLAHTDHGEVVDEVRRASIMGRRATPEVRAWFEQWKIRDSEQPVRTPPDATLGALERWCVPVRFRGSHLGYVWVLDRGHLGRQELEPAIDTADQIGALLYRRRLSAQADADFLRLLLVPSPEREHVATDALALGFHTHTGPVAVVVVATRHDEELGEDGLNDLALAAARAAEQASTETVLSGVISGLGVVLAPLRSAADLRPATRVADDVCRLASHFSHGLEFVAAIGGGTSLDRASHSYAESRRALRIVRAMPDLGPIVDWASLGIFRALALLPPEEVETGILDPRVRRLRENGELAVTAETFLDLAGNVQKTAARLHLHRATLYQRLERITALYDLDLHGDGDHRLLTHLGLKLARLAQAEGH